MVKESSFVLVEGRPGIGKSTLCWELSRQWDTFDSLRDFKVVLQLKLREKHVQEASSLSELFYHSDKELSKAVVEELSRCEGEGLLLILDGLDEMPISLVEDERKLIVELIRGICLPAATRLVTSRPSALYRKEDFFAHGYRHIEILGFTEKQISKYAEVAFKSEPEILTHFKNFIFSNPVISSLMQIPINCAINSTSLQGYEVE